MPHPERGRFVEHARIQHARGARGQPVRDSSSLPMVPPVAISAIASRAAWRPRTAGDERARPRWCMPAHRFRGGIRAQDHHRRFRVRPLPSPATGAAGRSRWAKACGSTMAGRMRRPRGHRAAPPSRRPSGCGARPSAARPAGTMRWPRGRPPISTFSSCDPRAMAQERIGEGDVWRPARLARLPPQRRRRFRRGRRLRDVGRGSNNSSTQNRLPMFSALETDRPPIASVRPLAMVVPNRCRHARDRLLSACSKGLEQLGAGRCRDPDAGIRHREAQALPWRPSPRGTTSTARRTSPEGVNDRVAQQVPADLAQVARIAAQAIGTPRRRRRRQSSWRARIRPRRISSISSSRAASSEFLELELELAGLIAEMSSTSSTSESAARRRLDRFQVAALFGIRRSARQRLRSRTVR